jgi:hypothetical protein
VSFFLFLKIFKTEVIPSPPVNITPPSIDNLSPKVGDTLTAIPGTYTGSPTGYLYQWVSGGSIVGGETSPTYVARGADDLKTISVQEQAQNGAGTSPATESAPTNQVTYNVPVVISAPVLNSTGSISAPNVGDILSIASQGVWTNSPSSYDNLFHYLGSGSSISGGSFYTIQLSDVGSQIQGSTVANNSGGSSFPCDTDSTGTVSPPA